MRFLLTVTAAFLSILLYGESARESRLIPKCATNLLSEMAEKVELDSFQLPEAVTDTVIFIPYKNDTVRVDIRNRKIEHIGLNIFNDTLRKDFAMMAPLDYIERTVLLERLPLKREISVAHEADSKEVLFHRTSLTEIPELARSTRDYSVNFIDEKLYSIAWKTDSANMAIVTIPAHYNLLKGTTLPENELRIFEDIRQLDSLPANHVNHIINDDHVQGTWKLNCFVIKGDALFNKYMNTDLYVQMADYPSEHFFEDLYNESYPAESFSNLMKGLDINNNFKVRLKTVIYPRHPETATVSITNLANYFLSQGCEIFTALTNLKDDEMVFWMLCKNTPMGYCHSLKLKFKISELEDREGIIPASFTAFVPFNKIKNLFADKKTE